MFALNWIYWFTVRLIFELMWKDDEPGSWKERLMYATWMALWWTVLWMDGSANSLNTNRQVKPQRFLTRKTSYETIYQLAS